MARNQLYYPLPLDTVSEWPGVRGGGWADHVGTDFAVPVGTPVRASFDGVVVFVGDDGLGGMTVDIQRSDGLIARYGHLSEYKVKVGQKVKAGQILALSGNTGMSTGPHLHWELRWDRLWTGGRWADPRKLKAKELTMKLTDSDIKKIAQQTAKYVLAARVKGNNGKMNSLGLFLKRTENRWAWLQARLTNRK